MQQAQADAAYAAKRTNKWIPDPVQAPVPGSKWALFHNYAPISSVTNLAAGGHRFAAFFPCRLIHPATVTRSAIPAVIRAEAHFIRLYVGVIYTEETIPGMEAVLASQQGSVCQNFNVSEEWRRGKGRSACAGPT